MSKYLIFMTVFGLSGLPAMAEGERSEGKRICEDFLLKLSNEYPYDLVDEPIITQKLQEWTTALQESSSRLMFVGGFKVHDTTRSGILDAINDYAYHLIKAKNIEPLKMMIASIHVPINPRQIGQETIGYNLLREAILIEDTDLVAMILRSAKRHNEKVELGDLDSSLVRIVSSRRVMSELLMKSGIPIDDLVPERYRLTEANRILIERVVTERNLTQLARLLKRLLPMAPVDVDASPYKDESIDGRLILISDDNNAMLEISADKKLTLDLKPETIARLEIREIDWDNDIFSVTVENHDPSLGYRFQELQLHFNRYGRLVQIRLAQGNRIMLRPFWATTRAWIPELETSM